MEYLLLKFGLILSKQDIDFAVSVALVNGDGEKNCFDFTVILILTRADALGFE